MSQVPPLVLSIADELDKCNRCGFCQTRCPVYRITGREASVARGHLQRLRATVTGEMSLDGKIREALFECLMCRACTAECPPAIQTDRVVFAARASYLARRQSPLQRFVFRTVFAHPRLLRTGARVLGWLKRARLTALSNLLRALPWLDRGYAEAPAWMPAPKQFLRTRLARRAKSETGTRRVTYFVGCAMDLVFPDAGESTVEVLEAAGCEVAVADNVCCGLPPYSYGDLASARALAQKNIASLASAEGEAIVTDCASCASFLKDYPELWEQGDPAREAAQQVAGRVVELSEFLAGLDPTALEAVEAVVTFHEPCHLGRYQGIVQEPRELIRRVPGVEFRELPEADWCCGGAGSYSMSHYDLSMEILARKMRNIASTGGQIVVTPCPACLIQLRYGAEKFGVEVEVIHLVELLRRALPSKTATKAR